jgi:hypothetical protein
VGMHFRWRGTGIDIDKDMDKVRASIFRVTL